MEDKNNITNNDLSSSYTNPKKFIHFGKNLKKTDIKKYKTKINEINQKTTIPYNNFTILNDSKRKQKQIKQCFYDIEKTKEKKEKNIKKRQNKIINEKEIEKEIVEKPSINKDKSKDKSRDKSRNKSRNKSKDKSRDKNRDKSRDKSRNKSKDMSKDKSKEENKSELKGIKYDSRNKDIKVNKIKIEKINLENTININSVTNRNFFQKSFEKIKNKTNNIEIEEPNIINKYISDFYNTKKSNLLSVKSFNKSNLEKELLNKELHNSEFINFMSPYNKNTLLYETGKNNYRYNLSTNTYSNNTTAGKSKISYNSSKILINFKNIKTFYAHLEIFVSLYLKKIFKYFIEKIKNYEKTKIFKKKIEPIPNEGMDGNNYRPIVNVNNAHCSLFCSINLNQDKLFNTIFDNRNINSIANNTFSPLAKSNDTGNIKIFPKGGINNINKRNRLLYMNPENDIHFSTNKRTEKVDNKSVYIPKKKISKSNTDIIKGIKANITNNLKSSPIKEMNINLKQINVCRLNDLNQLYLSQNQNLYKKNSNNFNFSEINPVITINNNNLTSHVKYNSNNIFSINNNNSNNKEKNKLKKIQSAKNGIYIKPKDKNNSKKIKEIKIKNRLSPIKKEIEYRKKENSIKKDNLLTSYNSFNKTNYLNDNSKICEHLNTITSNIEVNPIKKIYIKRGSQQNISNIFNLKENLFDSYKKQFYSTFLSFNPIKKNNNEILIKQITTSDRRVFISIKYFNYMNNNYIKKKKSNIFNYLKLKISDIYSISIINNKFELNDIMYKNMILKKLNNGNLKMQDIYSFDNDKKRNDIIKSKNISFSFKEYSQSKEESQDNKILNEQMIDFIIIFKNTIIKNIRKYILIKYKKIKCIKKLINNKRNKIINFYFLKFKKNCKHSKLDLNNCGVYHKINYNDDFNLTKKLKTPKNIPKNDNTKTHYKTKVYNLSSHNSINQFNNKNKTSEKRNLKEFSSNKGYKRTNKLMNKEINIVVHNNNNNINNNKNNNHIVLNKLKNKFFLMRIKLIKNALKMIKNAL